MKRPYTVVQFTDHFPGGDTLHRETWPMQALGTLPDFRVIDVHYLSPYRYQLAFDADLLVVCMILDPGVVPIMRWRKAKGKPTVFEAHHQVVFSLDPWTPTFEQWNIPSSRSACLQMMKLADMVQTTMPSEAAALEPYCSRVVVFPNQLADLPSSLPSKDDGPLVVGWGGSPSHFVDMARVAPAISKWITDHENVALWVMGDPAIADLFALPPGKKRHFPWGDMSAYEKFLRGVHVGLAPLCDTACNRGRSDVKWLEYAARGCVFIGQRMPPYSLSVEDGKTGFLFDAAAELQGILDRLYRDRGMMESVRRAAFDYVRTNRRHKDHIHERAQIYRELLGRERTEEAGKWDLHEHVRFPRLTVPDPLPGYSPVKPQPDEENALQTLFGGGTNIPENLIDLVEQRYGDFHRTAYARGQMAAVRGNLAEAERHLRRSLAFYPADVGSLGVLGRVLLAMGRLHEARQMFSLAVQWNEAYLAGYKYLVGIMEQESDWEAAIAVSRQWEKHNNHDMLACVIRGVLLVQAGRMHEGMDEIVEAMNGIQRRWGFWQLPFAAQLVGAFRKLDGSLSNEREWQDLIVKAAEMFPYGAWLSARAGAICFQRGEHERGVRILQAAHERLLEWEWQSHEGGVAPEQYRGMIEMYRAACEQFLQQS